MAIDLRIIWNLSENILRTVKGTSVVDDSKEINLFSLLSHCFLMLLVHRIKKGLKKQVKVTFIVHNTHISFNFVVPAM